jgi:hypothetical protein
MDSYGINSESMLDAANSAGRVSTQITDAGSSMKTDFSKTSKLNGGSVSEISKQLSILGSSTSSWQNIVTSNVNQGLDFDSRMSDVANDIEVPLDYTTNNAMDTNKYNAVFIAKMDGKSVDEGKETEKTEEIDDSTVAAKGLTNINDDQTKEQDYDDSTTIRGESILGNINGNQTEKQDYDDSTSVGNKKLKDISGDQTQEQEYDDNSVVRSKNLQNISGDQTQQQEYDANSNVRSQNLQDISGNQTQQQKYDDSTVIGKSILGSINSDNKTTQQSINDDAIAAAVENKKASDESDEEKQVVA